jgi:hypothetical protein
VLTQGRKRDPRVLAVGGREFEHNACKHNAHKTRLDLGSQRRQGIAFRFTADHQHCERHHLRRRNHLVPLSNRGQKIKRSAKQQPNAAGITGEAGALNTYESLLRGEARGDVGDDHEGVAA